MAFWTFFSNLGAIILHTFGVQGDHKAEGLRVQGLHKDEAVGVGT